MIRRKTGLGTKWARRASQSWATGCTRRPLRPFTSGLTCERRNGGDVMGFAGRVGWGRAARSAGAGGGAGCCAVLDHVAARAVGGTSTPSSLRVRCRADNRLAAEGAVRQDARRGAAERTDFRQRKSRASGRADRLSSTKVAPGAAQQTDFRQRKSRPERRSRPTFVNESRARSWLCRSAALPCDPPTSDLTSRPGRSSSRPSSAASCPR